MNRARSADIAGTACSARRSLFRCARMVAIGVPLHIVEHAQAHPFEVGNARRQQAFGPDDAARIEDGPRRHPDHQFLPFGAALPRAPGAVHGIDGAGARSGVAAAEMARKTPNRRCRDRRQRPPSPFPSIALTALIPLKSSVSSRGKGHTCQNRPLQSSGPRRRNRSLRPVSFAPISDLPAPALEWGGPTQSSPSVGPAAHAHCGSCGIMPRSIFKWRFASALLEQMVSIGAPELM
jgi:hypothetical protein